MFRWILGRIRCLGGAHERSYKHVVKYDDDRPYTSVCQFCGVRMERRAKRDWIVKR